MKAIETLFDNRRFRSRTEARWGVFFKALGWAYEYEREGLVLPSGAAYLPDFWLPEINSWLEVKGAAPSEREMDLCAELAQASGKRVLLAVGEPGGAGGLIWCGRELGPGDDPLERFELQSDRRDEDVFWLVAFDGSRHVCIGGPGRATDHERYPGRFGKLAVAYNKAKAARFEHGEKG